MCCELCGKYAASLLPYWRWRVVLALARSVPAIWPRGKQPQGYLISPGKPLTEGAGGALNVRLRAGLLSNQVARCLMGQAIDQTV
jgi:hypothetical protein